jgi:endoglucanase
VDNGVPVIIGEYAVTMRSSLTGQQRTDHIASREYYIKYVTNAAQQRGIKSFYWDMGTLTNGSALFDRNTGATIDQGTLTAIMQGAGVTTTQYITIKNRTTGLLIDGVGRTANGSNAGQLSSTSSNQQWLVETTGSYVKIKNRATGLYLDGMGRTTNGSIAGQWSSSTSNNQQWTIETTGSYSKLKNRATGLYIDGMGSTTSGADLAQWSSSSSNNQQWTITNVTARTATPDVVEQKSTESNVSLFPNPFTSGLHVSIRDPKEVKSIMVVDLTGNQVVVIQHDNIATEQTVGSLLNAGMYVVHINGLRSNQSFKVIKK